MEKNIHHAIIRVLSYFRFFKYPITSGEIYKYLGVKSTQNTVDISVARLEEAGIIFKLGTFYSLENNPEWAERRIAGNAYAQKQIIKARRVANFLGLFPFVESVCISGSLSKDFSAPDGDLDFFIITAPNRLWIARTVMHFFKKFTFLVGAQHTFCMNYYLDMSRLSVEPKNFFTAIELATLKPVFVRSGIHEMYAANKDWIRIFLPNNDCKDFNKVYMHDKWLPSRLVEGALNATIGNRLNNFLYKFTRGSWIRKWTRKGFDVDQCLKCISPYLNTPVNYPVNLPERIMEGYEKIYDNTMREVQKKTPSFGVNTIIVEKDK